MWTTSGSAMGRMSSERMQSTRQVTRPLLVGGSTVPPRRFDFPHASIHGLLSECRAPSCAERSSVVTDAGELSDDVYGGSIATWSRDGVGRFGLKGSLLTLTGSPSKGPQSRRLNSGQRVEWFQWGLQPQEPTASSITS